MEQLTKIRAIKIEAGSKIYCEGQKHAYELNENLSNIGVETNIGCDEAGFWNIYIKNVPDNVLSN